MNNYSDLRLYQGIAAPSNGTQMTLSFDYVRPSGYTSTVQVLGMTNGQYVQNWAGGTVQGTSLYTYTMSAMSSWTSVTNQGFTVNGTFTHLVLYVTVGGDAGDKLNNVVLSGPGGGGDTTPPATVSNLATSSPTSSSLLLSWTAPGDDGSTGTATTYDLRYLSSGAVVTTNWASATQVSGEPTPQVAGTNQSMTVSGLTASTTYYFGLETADEVPNWSAISNSPSGTTSAPADTTPPATTSNLATSSPTGTSITLTWTAPGDDGTTGTATTYDIRYRTGGTVVTTNWASATQCTGEPTPHVAGTGETFTVTGLTGSTTYYFGLETADEVPNWIGDFQLTFGHHDRCHAPGHDEQLGHVQPDQHQHHADLDGPGR